MKERSLACNTIREHALNTFIFIPWFIFHWEYSAPYLWFPKLLCFVQDVSQLSSQMKFSSMVDFNILPEFLCTFLRKRSSLFFLIGNHLYTRLVSLLYYSIILYCSIPCTNCLRVLKYKCPQERNSYTAL